MPERCTGVPMLIIEKVSKSYNLAPALDSVSLRASPASVTALIGGNGAGKSTFLRVIAGLVQADSGTLHWQGMALPAGLRREEIGFLPEERGLYQHTSVAGLLRYWAVLRGTDSTAIPAVCCEWAERLELTPLLQKDVSALSKGNQQKLQLAVCMLHSPRLLILDEPFSGLDPTNQDRVAQLIRDQADRGCTVVLSAHQLELVEQIADEVYRMDGGRCQPVAGFQSSSDNGAFTRARFLLIRFNRRPDAPFPELGGCSSQWTGPNELQIQLQTQSLGELSAVIQRIASHPDVVDVDLCRNNLRRAYLTHGAARGPMRHG